MTKEEEEAINFLELHTNFMGKLDKGRCIRIPEENFTKTKESIKTVLNMLKEKEAEIEQKNEVLNRVYDFIWENDCCRYFSKKHALCNQVLNFDSCLGDCKRNCIKQYFERKATNDG